MLILADSRAQNADTSTYSLPLRARSGRAGARCRQQHPGCSGCRRNGSGTHRPRSWQRPLVVIVKASHASHQSARARFRSSARSRTARAPSCHMPPRAPTVRAFGLLSPPQGGSRVKPGGGGSSRRRQSQFSSQARRFPPSHPIPSHPIPCCPIPCCPVSSRVIPSHPVSSSPAPCCVVLCRVVPTRF